MAHTGAHVSFGVRRDRFDLYIFRFIWSFNYGEMWRGHTQVTLFALFVCQSRKMRSQPPQPHQTTNTHAHNGNQKKAKIGRFSLFYWSRQHMVAERELTLIHFEILSMHFTQYAPIYLFYCLRLHRIALRPANDRWFDLNVNGMLCLCGMRKQRNKRASVNS